MVKKKVVKKRVVKKVKKLKLKVLPRKMSALIRIALADIRKAEKSDKFVVDMGTWYNPNKDLICRINDDDIIVSERKVCVACAAGSVMAFSLGLGADSTPKSGSYLLNSDENSDQLNAINSLRRGDTQNAAERLGLLHYGDEDNKKVFRRLRTRIPDYSMMDPEPFHKAMTALQAKLVKAGF